MVYRLGRVAAYRRCVRGQGEIARLVVRGFDDGIHYSPLYIKNPYSLLLERNSVPITCTDGNGLQERILTLMRMRSTFYPGTISTQGLTDTPYANIDVHVTLASLTPRY